MLIIAGVALFVLVLALGLIWAMQSLFEGDKDDRGW